MDDDGHGTFLFGTMDMSNRKRECGDVPAKKNKKAATINQGLSIEQDDHVLMEGRSEIWETTNDDNW